MKRERLDCPYDFTSRCTMGRCDCKPKEEMEKQQQGYSEEDLKYAFDSGRVRLTFDKERPFVFKNYEEFIEKFKNK